MIIIGEKYLKNRTPIGKGLIPDGGSYITYRVSMSDRD